MNTPLTKPTADDLNDPLFCMRQAHCWLARLYRIGREAGLTTDAEIAEAASIAVYVDLNTRHFKFGAVSGSGVLTNLFDMGTAPPKEAMQ